MNWKEILKNVIPVVLGLVLGYLGRDLAGYSAVEEFNAMAYNVTQVDEGETVTLRDGSINKSINVTGILGHGTYTAANTLTTSVTGNQVLYLSVDDNTTVTLTTPTYDQQLLINCDQDAATDTLFIPALTVFDTIVGDTVITVFYDKANTTWREVFLQ